MTTKDEVRSTVEALSTFRALKLALEALEDYVEEYGPHEKDSGAAYAITTIRSVLNEHGEAMNAPLAQERSSVEQPAQQVRWDSAAVDMTVAMATLPKTGSESVVDYKFVDGTKVSETRATIENGVVTSVTITNTAPPYINSTGADANIPAIPGTYYGIVPKGTGKITVTNGVQRKPWRGLTEEDANQLVEDCDWYNDPVAFCFDIEAKLKEKNDF